MQNAFLRPLSQSVWISVGVITSVGLLVFVALMRHEQQATTWEGATSIVLMIIGILSQQGFVEQVRTVRFKVTALIFICLSFCLFQFYSASIVGTLLTPFPKTIKTVEDLLNSDLKVILENVPSAGPIIKFYATEIYEKKIVATKSMSSYSMSDGLRMVQKGGYAFFVYIDQAREIIKRNFTSSEIDDLQEIDFVDQKFLMITIFPVRKFAPCRELVRVANKKVVEVGLKDYWNKKYISPRPFGSNNQIQIVDVSLGRISTLLFLLFYGLVASVVIFMTEMFIAKIYLPKYKKQR